MQQLLRAQSRRLNCIQMDSKYVVRQQAEMLIDESNENLILELLPAVEIKRRQHFAAVSLCV